jgi:exodeoxyribonuclease-3
VKIATWNVNGIRARQAQLLGWLAVERPDVLCLQELKAAPHQLAPELCDLAGYWCAWHGGGPYSGVGLHLARGFAAEPPAFTHPRFDVEQRIVTAELATAAGELVLASVYVPNGGRDYQAKLAFLERLVAWAGELRAQRRQLLLGGDLNVARTDRDVHPKERKPGVVGQRPEERQLIEDLLGQGLVDLGRALDPANEGLFTWWAPWRNLRQRNIGWRIDYLVASAELAATARSCRVLPEVGTSDHAPVVAELAAPTSGASPG